MPARRSGRLSTRPDDRLEGDQGRCRPDGHEPDDGTLCGGQGPSSPDGRDRCDYGDSGTGADPDHEERKQQHIEKHGGRGEGNEPAPGQLAGKQTTSDSDRDSYAGGAQGNGREPSRASRPCMDPGVLATVQLVVEGVKATTGRPVPLSPRAAVSGPLWPLLRSGATRTTPKIRSRTP